MAFIIGKFSHKSLLRLSLPPLQALHIYFIIYSMYQQRIASKVECYIFKTFLPGTVTVDDSARCIADSCVPTVPSETEWPRR